MSYTRLSVTWISSNVENVDEFGDLQPSTAISILARKQPHQSIIKTADGEELLSKSIYYVDPYIEKHAADIKYDDTLDGEIIKNIYVMCDINNKPKMYRFTTV